MLFRKIFVLFLSVYGCLFSPVIKAQNLAVTNLIYPGAAQLTCGALPYTDSLVVRVSNVGATNLSNFNVSVSLDGGTPQTEVYTGTVTAGNFVNYKFNGNLLINSQGYHTIKVYTSLTGDVNRANDTLQFVYMSRIKNFPYYENFESNNGGFSTNGTNTTWKWASPNKAIMKPGEGTLSWYNGVTTAPYYYNASDASVLNFPCYDFTNLKSPYISFKLFVEVENGWESITVEYSLNNGASWATLGSAGVNDCDRENWYNSGSTWTGNSTSYPCGSWGGGCPGGICGKWVNAKHCITNLAGQPSVTFRMRFASSGTQCQAEGTGIDSIVIADAPTPLFNFSSAGSCAGSPVSFIATSPDNCITAYSWDFGDNTARLPVKNAAHVYKDSGTYTVKLFVTSRCGKIDSLLKSVYIKPGAPISFGAIPRKYCISAMPTTLTGTPAGGKFYHSGVQVTGVDPGVWGLGKDSIVYEYTNVNGCLSRDTLEIEIYQPQLSIDNLGGNYCQFVPAFKLKGTPSGGSFLVDGVNDSMFRPAAIGLGVHTVTYIYNDSIGCSNSISVGVTVSNSLSVEIQNLDTAYCSEAPSFNLTGSPFGGIFYVNGVARTVFNPAQLAGGSNPDTVVYYYTDGTCFNSDTQFVKIIDINTVINGVKAIYCYNEASSSLSATPAGGIFTIDGVTVSALNPAALTAGNHRLVYRYQHPVYGCIDSSVHPFTIDKPVVNIPGLFTDYCINGDKVTPTGTPAGGVFEINGQPAVEIDPVLLGLGQHAIKYTYTSANGCKVSVSKTFKIQDKPQLQLTGFNRKVCFNSPAFTLQANPSGGAFTLDGLPVQKIDPSVLSLNVIHLVEYTYVDFQYGCINSITDSVFVGIPPSISITGTEDEYCTTDKEVLLGATPPGGTFTIDSMVALSLRPQVLGVGNHILTYTFTDANGCTNTITKPIKITGNPGDTITPGPVVEICDGEELFLNVNGSLPGVWSTGETTASVKVAPAQTADYWYKVLACVNYVDSVKVLVHKRPEANFTIDPSRGFMPLTTKIKNTSAAMLERWEIDNQPYTTDPLEHTFSVSGVFEVKQIVVDTNGCRDTLVQTVSVFDGITVPNVFSPNGDGTNDNFGPITQGIFNVYEFQIYDRWGVLLFTGSSPLERWDGTYKGNEAPGGVYYYVLKASNIKEFELTGSVTLIR